MKILAFTHLFPNSIQPLWGVFVYQRIAHIAKRPDRDVRVVAPVPYIPRWFPSKMWNKYKLIPRQEIVDGLVVTHPRYLHVPKIAMPLHGFLLFVGCFRHVAKQYREHRFDCIDSHWVYPDGFAAVLFGRMFGVPVFCSARGTDINVYPTLPLIRPLIRWALRRASGIVAVSDALKREILKFGIPAKNITVIGNGVDLSRFKQENRSEARKRLGLPLDGRLAVAVGSLNEHKCHAMLISAFAEISADWHDLRLFILGEGNLRASLEKLVIDKGLKGRVFLPGNQKNEELSQWYNAADFSCLSSIREGWPNVLLESLACGTPVVATRVGGTQEVIVSSELGILVEPNADALARGLVDALQKHWDRDTMASYARSRTWNEVAAEMDAFLTSRCCLHDP